jgi:hypothetical protein
MKVSLYIPTGKLIEMSSSSHYNTLLINAVGSGYSAGDVEIKDVTPAEWEIIKYEDEAPVREQQAQKETIRQDKEQAVKSKLGLNDKDWSDLKEVLR